MILTGECKNLKSGFIANVNIYPSNQAPYVFVPVEAIVKADKQKASVYAINSLDSVYSVDVVVPRLFKDYAVISKGLNGIDEVVTDGVNYIDDQSSVLRIN